MKKWMQRWISLTLALCMLATTALGEGVFVLPASLKVIDEEAFYGNTSIDKVIVPDGATEIRSKAFANSSVSEIELPDTLTVIEEDAFADCEEVLFVCNEDSLAYQYAQTHDNIKLQQLSVPESAHPYADEFDYTWTYDAGEDTESVTITFSADTETEEDYDFIYIYTLDDVQVGKYSGTELAGQSVTIDGTGFKLRLTSDEAWGGGNTYYGFKLDNIAPKKAVPLTFDSVIAESSTVNAGETIRWTVATTGGKSPVYYDYTVLLGEEEVATGTVEAPSAIEYTPVRAGEYKLSVIVRDSGTAVLPEQASEIVTVAPSTAYPESAHPYAANTDQRWVYAAEENVESLTVTFSSETKTESRYDYIWLYDQNGTQIGKYDGTTLAGQAVEIQGSAFSIRLTSDNSQQNYGFAITSIEKHISGPLTFISLLPNKTEAQTGDVIIWTMETVGGSRPVTYEYDITLNGETKASGSIIRPEAITYVPIVEGDYTLSVVTKDADGSRLPAQTSTVHIVQRGDTPAEYFTVEPTSDGFGKITAYTGPDTVVMIPKMIDGCTIESIGDNAFKDNTNIVSVITPESLKEIGKYAFYGCTNLRKIELNDGLDIINVWAFGVCSSLNEIYIPNSVTTLGYCAFRNCNKLAKMNYPIGWTTTYNSDGDASDGYFGGIFEGTLLETMHIPSGATIPNAAFSSCSNFSSITIADSDVTLSGNEQFGWCTGLTTMSLPDEWTSLSVSMFRECTNLTSIILPENLEVINECALYGCTSLKKLYIPDSVETIHRKALSNCSSLEELYIPNSVKKLGYRAFYGCYNLEKMNYPMGWISTIDGYATGEWGGIFAGTALTEMHIPSGATIPNAAFADCPNFSNITIENGVTLEGLAQFLNCTGLTTMVLPEDWTEVRCRMFEGCTRLESVILNEGLETLEGSAFRNCIGLTRVYLPSSIRIIEALAFAGCTNLSEMNYPLGWEKVDPYSGGIFSETALDTLVIPEGVTTIPKRAFSYSTNFTYFELPDSMQSIPASAFANCTGLEKIWIPERVESIASNAFENVSTSTLTIHGVSGSYAETFAAEKGYPFVAEPFEYVPATLSGTVTDAAGSPFSGVTVTVYKGPTTNYPFGTTTTNASGAWTMENVKVGSYYGVGFEKEGYTFSPSITRFTVSESGNTIPTAIGSPEGETVSVLTLSVSTWNCGAASSVRAVTVDTDDTWEITSCPDWMTVYQDGDTAATPMMLSMIRTASEETGSDESNIFLMITEDNDDSTSRTGEVVVTNGSAEKTIKVLQSGRSATLANGGTYSILSPVEGAEYARAEIPINITCSTAATAKVEVICDGKTILSYTDEMPIANNFAVENTGKYTMNVMFYDRAGNELLDTDGNVANPSIQFTIKEPDDPYYGLIQTLNYGVSGGTQSVSFENVAELKVSFGDEVQPTWLTLTYPTLGSMRITAAENATGEARSCLFDVITDLGSKTLEIKQNGSDDSVLTITQTSSLYPKGLIGQKLTYGVLASGGAGNYTYTFDLYRNGVKYDTVRQRSNVLIYEITEGETYYVVCTVSDGKGQKASVTSSKVVYDGQIIEFVMPESDGKVYQQSTLPNVTWKANADAVKYGVKIRNKTDDVLLASFGLDGNFYDCGDRLNVNLAAYASRFENNHTYNIWVAGWDEDDTMVVQGSMLISVGTEQDIDILTPASGSTMNSSDLNVTWDVSEVNAAYYDLYVYTPTGYDLTYTKTNAKRLASTLTEFVVPADSFAEAGQYTIKIMAYSTEGICVAQDSVSVNVYVGEIKYTNITSNGTSTETIKVYSDDYKVSGYSNHYFPKDADDYGIIDFGNSNQYTLSSRAIANIETIRTAAFGAGQSTSIGSLWGEYYLGTRSSDDSQVVLDALHEGIDISCSTSDNIYSLTNGKVVKAHSGSLGTIVVETGDYCIVYMHCAGSELSVGDTVAKGDLIGTQGSVGTSSKHLHLGVRKTVNCKSGENYYFWSDSGNNVNDSFAENGTDMYSLLVSLMGETATTDAPKVVSASVSCTDDDNMAWVSPYKFEIETSQNAAYISMSTEQTENVTQWSIYDSAKVSYVDNAATNKRVWTINYGTFSQAGDRKLAFSASLDGSSWSEKAWTSVFTVEPETPTVLSDDLAITGQTSSGDPIVLNFRTTADVPNIAIWACRPDGNGDYQEVLLTPDRISAEVHVEQTGNAKATVSVTPYIGAYNYRYWDWRVVLYPYTFGVSGEANKLSYKLIPTTDTGTSIAAGMQQTSEVAVVRNEISVPEDELLAITREIIFGNEGSYTTVAQNDGGSMSIGLLQWNANAGRALPLLRKIINLNKANALSVLGQTLYDEIMNTSTSWTSANRVASADEAAAIAVLLGTSEGVQAQEAQANDDVKGYLDVGRSYGVTNPQVLVYFADLYNQSPARAKNIMKDAISTDGMAIAVTLDTIHEVAMAEPVMSKYSTRRNRTYGKCKNIEGTVSAEPVGDPTFVDSSIPASVTSGVTFTLKWNAIEGADAYQINYNTVDGKVKDSIAVEGSITECAITIYSSDNTTLRMNLYALKSSPYSQSENPDYIEVPFVGSGAGVVGYEQYTGIDYTAALNQLLANGTITQTEYNNRISLLAEAKDICTVIWTSPVSFHTWQSSAGVYNSNENMVYSGTASSNVEFCANVQYVGIPYCMKSGGHNTYDVDAWNRKIKTDTQATDYEGKIDGVRTHSTLYGVDCGGLVVLAYHTFDTTFSHDTTTNWTSASYLSKTTSPIPGDLILKSGHVMIYLGKTASGKIAVFEAVADGENGYSGSRYYEHDSVSG